MKEQAMIDDLNATLKEIADVMPMARKQGRLDEACAMYTAVYLLKLRAMTC